MGFSRITNAIINGFIVASGVAFACSLYWQISTPAEGDSGFLNYFAWLITKHDYTPYRDLFDTSFPMAVLFHIAATWMGHASETTFQLTNVALLLVASALAYRILARIDRRVAWIAIVTFGLFYECQDIALARDFQGLLWLLCAINILITTSWKIEKRVFVASLFFALAVATKPHFIISVFPLMFYIWQQEAPSIPSALRLTALSVVTGIATASLPFIWLWSSGGWPAFIDIFTGYLPLYMELSGNIHVVTPAERAQHLLEGWLNLIKYLLPLMAASLFLFFRNHSDVQARRLAILLAAEAITFSLYVVIGGKFWLYQQTPYLFFVFSVIALAFCSPYRSKLDMAAASLLMCVMIFASFSMSQFIVEKQHKPYSSRTIVNYLAERKATSSTTVQLWQYNTDGARALWLAGVKPATPHVTYEAFYHHVSHPYTKRLRMDLIAQLQKKMPDIIIRERRLFIPAGEDSTNRFDEFDEFVSEHYVVDTQNDYYIFYIRKS